VVIRNDVAGRIPDEAGAGLLAAPFVRRGKIGYRRAMPATDSMQSIAKAVVRELIYT
jgi:hypothetical protein